MPLAFKQPKKQFCPKCHWESDIIQYGDCLIGIVEQCPKCNNIIPLALKEANNSIITKLFNTFKNAR